MFVACGLNHKSAPLTIREKIAIPDNEQKQFLNRIIQGRSVREAAILSTCNRTELYCTTDDSESLIEWFAQLREVPTDFLKPYFYLHQGKEGIRHALRVATGLDSMILGEPQILGQMKQAYQNGCHFGSVKKHLHHLFQHVFSVAKKVRNESEIGHYQVSIASTAYRFIKQFCKGSDPLQVLLIGSGELASLVGEYLKAHQISQFYIASRTPAHANKLSENLSGEALTITDIPRYLPKVDVVISATACPLPFITTHWVKEALHIRNNKPMLLIDLAIPRDIEPEVGDLQNVVLYNIDDFQQTVEEGKRERVQASLVAEAIIDEEIDTFFNEFLTQQAGHLIGHYRNFMEQMAYQELRRSRHKLKSGVEPEVILHELTYNLVNKLLHEPTLGLRKAAGEGREDILELIHYLFGTQSKYETIT